VGCLLFGCGEGGELNLFAVYFVISLFWCGWICCGGGGGGGDIFFLVVVVVLYWQPNIELAKKKSPYRRSGDPVIVGVGKRRGFVM
jgi:hypothetical protein